MSEQTYTTRIEPQEPLSLEAMEKAIQSLREEFPDLEEPWCINRWCLNDLLPPAQRLEQTDDIRTRWLYKGW